MKNPKNKTAGNDPNEKSCYYCGTASCMKAENSFPNAGHPICSQIIGKIISNMVRVEGGSFIMGDKGSDQLDEDESYKNPAHQVRLSAFHIGRYAVTQEEWMAVMGHSPSYFEGKQIPVTDVSWEECQEFIRMLNAITGMSFRLPTEAEWEFAARGGKTSKGYMYAGGDELDSVAWHFWNGDLLIKPVGQKQPNELDLYDMSGNVWEWCCDWYGEYSTHSQIDPKGPETGSARVIRGGSISSFNSSECLVTCRSGVEPGCHHVNLGLRLAL